MRYLVTLLVSFSLALSGSASVSANNQAQKAAAKPLTNADVLDMLNAGVSQEVVIAKQCCPKKVRVVHCNCLIERK